MKARQLIQLGIPNGPAIQIARKALRCAAAAGLGKADRRRRLMEVIEDPAACLTDLCFGALARALSEEVRGGPLPPAAGVARSEPAPWRQWGDDLEPQSIQQMVNACSLPIAVRGALMPDAHLGYGLPIGGVLATDNAVIPYAVGVDIACRMKMTVLDLPVNAIAGQTDRLVHAINRETEFGIGAEFSRPHDHEVMDEDWSFSPVTDRFKDKAHRQLGTSGSGNHFVEFGILDTGSDFAEATGFDLPPGQYLALLTHSGSRGTGALVAGHYSRLAAAMRPELVRPLRHLAWLDLDTEAGQEYWHAMQLMGRYAQANHAIIHRMIARHLKVNVLADIENHHNFAWKETHTTPTGEKRKVIVHRKGATPAAAGDIGIIPGSMASPAYVVRGRGSEESLNSASHGAGRVMSRSQAKRTYTWSAARKYLDEKGVKLICAGLDEVPWVYKDIDKVMADQQDLVEVLARFDPKIVKMSPGGRAED
ncbi:MAG: RtcB family protein [Phycisphaerales bacterium]|nr:MAG: RtcB family protein [Phycisphaerales bacterium]